MKRAQIKVGAWVGQDSHQKHWPIGDVKNVIFDIKNIWGGRFKCIAPRFGGIPYCNGPLFVDRRDLIPLVEGQSSWPCYVSLEETTTMEEGFQAAVRHLDYKTMTYVIDPRPWLRKRVLPTEHRADIEAICKALILKSEKRIIKAVQDSNNPL